MVLNAVFSGRQTERRGQSESFVVFLSVDSNSVVLCQWTAYYIDRQRELRKGGGGNGVSGVQQSTDQRGSSVFSMVVRTFYKDAERAVPKEFLSLVRTPTNKIDLVPSLAVGRTKSCTLKCVKKNCVCDYLTTTKLRLSHTMRTKRVFSSIVNDFF